MVVGVGIDLFDVARIERETARRGRDLLDELFTASEREASEATRRPGRAYSARFAAKEACFKALGTGKIGSMSWHDIEVSFSPSGAAGLALGGETARVAAERGVARVVAAVSVTARSAVAWVVAVAAGNAGSRPAGGSDDGV